MKKALWLWHRAFLDTLAGLSPVVEPGGLDAAYVHIADSQEAHHLVRSLRRGLRARSLSGRLAVIGLGPSRLAARTCAECDLLPERLPGASAAYLWPEDAAIVARLHRLGLTTFGDVAALTESVLVYQFGARIGRLLFHRAQGRDFTPVRALYPPPRAEAYLNFGLEPLESRPALDTALEQLADRAARQLRHIGRHGRRVRLCVRTETEISGESEAEWVTPAPVQDTRAILSAARLLLRRIEGQGRIDSPIAGLRLFVDDLDLPAAASGDLFEPRQRAGERKAALEAVRRLLVSRYGVQCGLRTLGEMPVETRDRRRVLVRERQRYGEDVLKAGAANR